MPVVFSGLMCHAPIVLPDVGGLEARRCAQTTRAMREMAQRVVRAAPDRLVLLSPHSPRHRTLHAAWTGRHRGDLAAFRAPQHAVDLPDAPEVARAMGAPAVDADEPLDHGAMVPLAFLWDAGWRGPTAILSVPWQAGEEAAVGRILAGLPGRTAVIASGDMSHRLRPGAPAGYHPDAERFDEAFVTALRDEDWPAACAAPHREEAAEDVVQTTAVAMAAAGEPVHAEVLSYEGPFGVGYAEAILRDDDPPLYAIARRHVRAAVLGHPVGVDRGGPPAAGVFVTLTKDGALRGCIGHVAPITGSLWAEIAEVAPAAALADPRFPPVTPNELDDLKIEVSVLEPPEDIDGPDQLDPRTYGVIVTRGMHRGLLLPDLDGVDTPAQQIAIATAKAHLPPGAEVRLQRFRVRKEASP